MTATARRQPAVDFKPAPKTKPKSKPTLTVVPEAAPALTIIDALNDPDLFGKFFIGDSWDGWRTVLKATFALPMNETETAFFQSVAGDRLAPTEAVRELWAVCARRAGKDSHRVRHCSFVAATFNQQNKLRPGRELS